MIVLCDNKKLFKCSHCGFLHTHNYYSVCIGCWSYRDIEELK